MPPTSSDASRDAAAARSSLAAWAEPRRGRLGWDDIAPIARGILEALGGHGVHGALHPEGIVLHETADKASPPTVTLGPDPRGSEAAPYAAPEVLDAARSAEVGAWSDLYAWAMILIELLGRHPTVDRRPQPVAERQRYAGYGYDEYDRLSSMLYGVPDPVIALLQDCVALDPAARPRRVSDARARLTETTDRTAGGPAPATTPSPDPLGAAPSAIGGGASKVDAGSSVIESSPSVLGSTSSVLGGASTLGNTSSVLGGTSALGSSSVLGGASAIGSSSSLLGSSPSTLGVSSEVLGAGSSTVDVGRSALDVGTAGSDALTERSSLLESSTLETPLAPPPLEVVSRALDQARFAPARTLLTNVILRHAARQVWVPASQAVRAPARPLDHARAGLLRLILHGALERSEETVTVSATTLRRLKQRRAALTISAPLERADGRRQRGSRLPADRPRSAATYASDREPPRAGPAPEVAKEEAPASITALLEGPAEPAMTQPRVAPTEWLPPRPSPSAPLRPPQSTPGSKRLVWAMLWMVALSLAGVIAAIVMTEVNEPDEKPPPTWLDTAPPIEKR